MLDDFVSIAFGTCSRPRVVEEKVELAVKKFAAACMLVAFINIFATKMFQENQSEGRAPVVTAAVIAISCWKGASPLGHALPELG
jgi:hypothetical protein